MTILYIMTFFVCGLYLGGLLAVAHVKRAFREMDEERKWEFDEFDEMSDKSEINCGGCVCITIIVTIFVLWALWFGVPTPWGKFNIDIFPPRIWDMNAV